MLDLLVGCKALVRDEDSKQIREGVIVRVDRNDSDKKVVWILFQQGNIEGHYLEGHHHEEDISKFAIIHPDDVKFIMDLNKNHKLREQILAQTTDRFSIMDFDNDN